MKLTELQLLIFENHNIKCGVCDSPYVTFHNDKLCTLCYLWTQRIKVQYNLFKL